MTTSWHECVRNRRGIWLSCRAVTDRRMEYIEAALTAGQNVLADKPWITDIKDLPRLEAALNMAESKRLIAYDAMTQRFDIAYQIQQALVNDRELFGVPASVMMESSHYLLKSGTRPVWFLDTARQGEGMADVGTHLVDLIEWTLFPARAIDYKADVRVIDARRWPLMLSRDDFQRVTGEKDWPKFAEPLLKDGMFPFYGNSETSFTIRGVQGHCKAVWNFEQKPGFRDTMLAVYTGSIARVQVRQNKEENFLPEVDVAPIDQARKAGLRERLSRAYTRLLINTRALDRRTARRIPCRDSFCATYSGRTIFRFADRAIRRLFAPS